MIITNSQPWKGWQKIIFRFFFLLFMSSTIFCWDLSLYFAVRFFVKGYEPGKIYTYLVKPFQWLDKYIFHTGYDSKIHQAFPEDNHFGVVFYLTLLLLAIIGSIVWSIMDKKRPSYDKLYYWFRLYIRYVLGIVMFGYGIDKFIPVQMAYPNVVTQLTAYGEQTRFEVLWNFMGAAPGYQIMTGAAEILGSLLLLSRRTVVAGSLLTGIILCNVVAFNIFYNVPVKMFSTQLLIYDLFLLMPFFNKITRVFYKNEAVELKEKQIGPLIGKKRIVIPAVLFTVPFLIFLFTTLTVSRFWSKRNLSSQKQKLYEVSAFIAKDTLAPLLTDTLRWKRFAFSSATEAVVFSMKDAANYYTCDIDSLRKNFILHDNPDSSTWQTLHYEYPAKGELLLTGKWKKQDVRIHMKELSIDSMTLQKDKAKWVLD